MEASKALAVVIVFQCFFSCDMVQINTWQVVVSIEVAQGLTTKSITVLYCTDLELNQQLICMTI